MQKHVVLQRQEEIEYVLIGKEEIEQEEIEYELAEDDADMSDLVKILEGEKDEKVTFINPLVTLETAVKIGDGPEKLMKFVGYVPDMNVELIQGEKFLDMKFRA